MWLRGEDGAKGAGCIGRRWLTWVYGDVAEVERGGQHIVVQDGAGGQPVGAESGVGQRMPAEHTQGQATFAAGQHGITRTEQRAAR